MGLARMQTMPIPLRMDSSIVPVISDGRVEITVATAWGKASKNVNSAPPISDSLTDHQRDQSLASSTSFIPFAP
jgi:hypothetical protein